MKKLISAVAALPEFQALTAAMDNGACPVAFHGLGPVHRAQIAAGVWQEQGRPIVFICADDAECDRQARELTALTGERVRTMTAREFTFHNAAVVSRQWEHARLSTLRALAAGECPI